jgi:hypothetical protein
VVLRGGGKEALIRGLIEYPGKCCFYGWKIIEGVNLVWRLVWLRSSVRRQGRDLRSVRGPPGLGKRGDINGSECARNYCNQETEERRLGPGLPGCRGEEREDTTRRIGDRCK